MQKIILLIAALVLTCAGSTIAQKTFLHTNLSPYFNYKLVVNKFTDKVDNYEIGRVTSVDVFIITKGNNQEVQHITIDTDSTVMYNAYTSNLATTSYITGKMIEGIGQDGEYGDFVVMDINFDGREDFAVKVDVSASAGAMYQFYTMQPDGKYKLDQLLSNISYFPINIFPDRKEIQVYSHGNNRIVRYRFMPHTQSWLLMEPQVPPR